MGFLDSRSLPEHPAFNPHRQDDADIAQIAPAMERWQKTPRNVFKPAVKRRYKFGIFVGLAFAATVPAQASRPADRPTQSAHRRGPDGLEGWTLESPVPGSGYGDERFASTLVIARHGHVIRRIPGDPFIWEWVFWAGGRQIAYETGPFHFGEACFLIRLSDGRRLESYDCYRRQAAAKPDWVRALDARQQTDSRGESAEF